MQVYIVLRQGDRTVTIGGTPVIVTGDIVVAVCSTLDAANVLVQSAASSGVQARIEAAAIDAAPVWS